MRSFNHRKSAVTGVISVLVLLVMFPVVSSAYTAPPTGEVAEEEIHEVGMLSPIPIIVKPENGGWYVNDDLWFSGMPTTRIVGAITVTVKCIDPTGNGLQKVVFKVDDVAVGVDSTPTFDDGYYWFEWLCGDELPTGEHELKVVAFDNLGNSQEKSITVIKGLVLDRSEYSVYLEVTENLGLEGLEVVEIVEMPGFYTLIFDENYYNIS
jgi:hypothetical protein